MVQNHKLSTLIVLIFTIIFAGCNIYKMITTTEENLKQFLCHHVRHDEHKDMLHKHQHHRKDDEKVRSHTIETEEISFEEKLRRDREARDDETDYQMELRGEGKCRAGITREQLDGLWFLNKVGLISSFVSLVASVVALAAMRSREDGTNRFLLIPYIMVHPGLIGMEIFALIYSYKLVHTMSSIHVVMVSLSVLLLVIFTSLVVLFYKALSALPLGAQNSSIGKGKEAFDYSTMPEEKDASEA